jgi:hypothetical protein
MGFHANPHLGDKRVLRPRPCIFMSSHPQESSFCPSLVGVWSCGGHNNNFSHRSFKYIYLRTAAPLACPQYIVLDTVNNIQTGIGAFCRLPHHSVQTSSCVHARFRTRQPFGTFASNLPPTQFGIPGQKKEDRSRGAASSSRRPNNLKLPSL